MTIQDEEQQEVEIEAESGSNEKRKFPDAFYDAKTGEIMTDPVVNPEGDSVDKSTINTDGSSETYYPNRALKAIIQSEVELAAKTWEGSVRRLDHAMQSGWGKLLEKSAFGIEYRPLPDSFYCPIMCELITDPVVSKYGISYERDAIVNWVQSNGKSPMTRDPLTLADLRDNNALYDLIQREKGRTMDSIHPSIRRWKESGDATSRRARPLGDDSPEEESYPTSEEQIEARRRMRRDQRKANWLVVIFFTTLLMVALGPYIFGVVLFFSVSFCCCCYLLGSCSEDEGDE